MSPNYSSCSSTEMDGVGIITPHTSSSTSSDSRATTAATTTDQQVISKQTLPLKSCLASSHSRSTVGSTTTRPALCEIVGGSSRLDNNGDDIHDAQAQRHDNSRRDRHDRRGRRLTFNNRTRVFLIPTLAELTTGEFAATYRTPDDDTANQQDIIRTIQAMAQHNFHDGGALPPALLHDGDDDAASSSATSSTTDELTTRGLEHMRSSEHVRERKETKLLVTDAILDEQEEQWDCGRTVAESEDDIADVSRAVTSRSVLEALERAAGDAAYVRRVVAHDLQCQQQQQQATAITSDMQLGRSLHNLSPADDLPHGTETSGTTSRSVDANSITVPHSSFLNQATPNSWSVASTPTTNALLDQIASNASMAMMTNKNKMSSTTSMPTTAPTLPSVTTYLSRSAPI